MLLMGPFQVRPLTLTPHRATYKSDPMSESAVETPSELQQPIPCPAPSGADPVLNAQLPLPWHSSMPFPRALSLSHRAELSAAPPLPVRSCSRHEASPHLLCSVLSKPGPWAAPHTPCPTDPSRTLYPPLLDTLEQFCVHLILWCPNLHPVLRVRLHHCGVREVEWWSVGYLQYGEPNGWNCV